jgi:hypothetical protein
MQIIEEEKSQEQNTKLQTLRNIHTYVHTYIHETAQQEKRDEKSEKGNLTTKTQATRDC